MADLKPCPFCGAAAEIERYGDRRQSTIYRCTQCSCSLETGEEWGHGSDWNQRADAGLRAEAERLRKALRSVLATGLNGGNNVRLAFIAAGGRALPDELLAQAEASERAVQEARAALSPRPADEEG